MAEAAARADYNHNITGSDLRVLDGLFPSQH
jgi:hypothetical protein